ncbi:SpoIIAA-like [Stigmatella aurantiaca]|uniref:SpoIIAA-like n=1 Tax=Stigmatella aurantiaca TaxID=41 RepID=A0A1H7FCC4_STIAU|nr:STAS/SEC14 domain-containing protein [Stigmatella aurantiaca]SEK23394.1 SpoIIAA-like [Stigmatella aurantiaca]
MERQFGQHTIAFEAPDIVRFVFRGDIEPKDQQGMHDFVEELHARHGLLYLLGDLRLGTGLSPETRKRLGHAPTHVPYKAMVFFGASFSMRTLFNMLNRAYVLMSRTTVSTVFVETEQEAREWISQQRALPPSG